MTAEPDAALVFRALEPGEGAKLVDCVRRCYGDTHVDPGLYDVAAVDAALADGSRRSAVGVTPDGEVIAHLGLVLRRPGDVTADAGLTMVDPRYRGRGLARRLSVEVGCMANELGLVGLHDYPVTVHAGTQRLAKGAPVVGLLLDNMPADVDFQEMEAPETAGATASLVRYMALRPAPARVVHLPAPYVDLARRLYEQCGLDRAVRSDTTPPAGETGFESHRHARRGVLVHAVSAGRESTSRLEEASTSELRVTQIDLPLDGEGTPHVASRLRGAGFFFGALLPEFRDGDVLRLQRLSRALDPGAAPVLEDHTREIADFVAADATAVSALAAPGS